MTFLWLSVSNCLEDVTCICFMLELFNGELLGFAFKSEILTGLLGVKGHVKQKGRKQLLCVFAANATVIASLVS